MGKKDSPSALPGAERPSSVQRSVTLDMPFLPEGGGGAAGIGGGANTPSVGGSGHGGNGLGVGLGFQRAWEKYPDLQPAYWTYYGVGGEPMSHADDTETSIAIAIGATVHMDRASDFVMPKLWHEVSSRRAIAPHSGAVNGHPTLATREQGEAAASKIIGVLVEKVAAIIANG